MYGIISVLIIITCVLLILIVLVQQSKGGGLISTLGSSTQFMGVKKTADFLEKATWTLAIALLVLSLIATIAIPRHETSEKVSEIQSQIENFQPSLEKMNFPKSIDELESTEEEEK